GDAAGRLEDHGVALDQAALVAELTAGVTLAREPPGRARRVLQLNIDTVDELLLATDLLLDQLVSQFGTGPLGPRRRSRLGRTPKPNPRNGPRRRTFGDVAPDKPTPRRATLGVQGMARLGMTWRGSAGPVGLGAQGLAGLGRAQSPKHGEAPSVGG